ncbi:hypothetical protein QJS04_geneDACA002915 [Acorus gramineus]|uniref:Uncharacterized protein n=1 Tax=Acorus gramineus TaxID=55184 RepID=A0AAV9BZ17_ACOGR|nr:hypothetical protein QJS04_geneDACA002915 [Acorus gramineus]
MRMINWCEGRILRRLWRWEGVMRRLRRSSQLWRCGACSLTRWIGLACQGSFICLKVTCRVCQCHQIPLHSSVIEIIL